MREPLMAMVALFAKTVRREARRRSVVPGREVGAIRDGRSLLVLDGVYKQAEVCRRGGVRQRARRKKVGSGLGIRSHVFEGDAARNFYDAVSTKAAGQLAALFRFGWRHVVEQHGFGTGGKRFAKLAFVAHFNLNWQNGIRGTRWNSLLVCGQRHRLCVQRGVGMRLIESLLHSAGKRDVVFLQKDRVVKTDSVVGAATDFYRVFFEQTQTGSRFTRIANPCTRSLNLFDKTMDHCRDAAEPAEKIQSSAFSGKNCACFSFQVKENRSFADRIAVVNAKLNPLVRIESAKNSFGHW